MGLQLRRLRKSKRMTQEELGSCVNQTARVIGAWEREETGLPIDDAARIADVLDCTLDELAGRDFHPDVGSQPPEARELVEIYQDANPQGRAAIMAVARSQQGVEGSSAPAARGA